MATARAFSALNLLDDGRVLAAGGLVTLLPLATNTAEIYSPSTGTWAAAASLNSARYSGVSATLAAGPILIGGINGGSPLATSESYDSVHNTWTQLPTAYGAVSQTATAMTMTSVLVAGGNTGSAATTCAQIYGVLNGFAVYAQRSVTLGSSDHINGGDVGVTSVAPSAFGPQLIVGSSTTVQTNHNLAAPSVSLGSQAQVGDVQTNSLTNAGATLGTQAPYPSSLPATPLALPPGPGGSSVTVPALTTTTLNPGNYGALSVTGTVFLNAGNYTFASVTMANQAHFAGVSGTATVSVAGTFQAGNSVSISSPGAAPADSS
jgi:Kelch motif